MSKAPNIIITIPDNIDSLKLLEKLNLTYFEEIEMGNEKLTVYKIEND